MKIDFHTILEDVMSFSESVAICFMKFATFDGRATRSEFWYFQFFLVLAKMLSDLAHVPRIFGIIDFCAIIFLLPNLAVTVRRLQDVGKPWWWLPLLSFSIVGLPFLIYLLLKPTAIITVSETHNEM